MFRQKLQPGGSALVPIISETAKRSMKMPLWNMLKFGALPWALDQAVDLMTMDLKTQEPDSTKSPNDQTTATLDLNEKIEKDITTSSNFQILVMETLMM